MYNEKKKKSVMTYQSKFTRFSVMIPKGMDEMVRQAANGKSRQQYIWGLVLEDMRRQGLIDESIG